LAVICVQLPVLEKMVRISVTAAESAASAWYTTRSPGFVPIHTVRSCPNSSLCSVFASSQKLMSRYGRDPTYGRPTYTGLTRRPAGQPSRWRPVRLTVSTTPGTLPIGGDMPARLSTGSSVVHRRVDGMRGRLCRPAECST